MGQTFEEMKASFIGSYVANHPLTDREKRAGITPDNAANLQWSRRIKDVVTNRVHEEATPSDCLHLMFDDSRHAISDSCGWIVFRDTQGNNSIRVAAGCSTKFVVCLYQGAPTAMTILQAYRNGCREMEWPMDVATC